MSDTPTSAAQQTSRRSNRALADVVGPDHYTDAVSAVADVAEGRTTAAVVPGYLSAAATRGLREKILASPDLADYRAVEVADGVGAPLKIGSPYYDTQGDAAAERRYWAESSALSRRLRALFDPLIPPMDRLRLELDEGPAGGRRLRNAEGDTAFAGLVRVFRKGAEALPHTDHLGVYAPPGRLKDEPICQLAVNAFVAGGEGGEVELWAVRPAGAEYRAMLEPGSYGIARHRLGTPIRRISPRTGDLIILDARYVHAVRPVMRGPRITVSAFIVRFRPSDPFFMYS